MQQKIRRCVVGHLGTQFQRVRQSHPHAERYQHRCDETKSAEHRDLLIFSRKRLTIGSRSEFGAAFGPQNA
jgi:hypothetical protein